MVRTAIRSARLCKNDGFILEKDTIFDLQENKLTPQDQLAGPV
jgi:hypothetical protein